MEDDLPQSLQGQRLTRSYLEWALDVTNNFEIMECVSNGNCFYDASSGATNDNEIISSHRNGIVNYLRENYERFVGLINAEEDMNDFFLRHDTTGSWADHVILQAHTDMKQKITVVYDQQRMVVSKIIPRNKNENDCNNDRLYLLYTNGNHYDLLLPKEHGNLLTVNVNNAAKKNDDDNSEVKDKVKDDGKEEVDNDDDDGEEEIEDENKDENLKSEYELLREKKIKRNQSRLLELGLVKPGKQAPKRKASPAVKKKITKKTLPIRRSARQISIKYPSFKVGDSSGDSGSDASISDADSNSSDVMASKQRNEKKKTKPQIWQLARWNGQVIVNMTPQELRKKIRDADGSDFDKMSNSSQRAILIRLGLSSKGSLKAALKSKILLVKNGKEDQVPKGYLLDPNLDSSTFRKKRYKEDDDNALKKEVQEVICGEGGSVAFKFYNFLKGESESEALRRLISFHDGFIHIRPTPGNEELYPCQLLKLAGLDKGQQVFKQNSWVTFFDRYLCWRVLYLGKKKTQDDIVRRDGVQLFLPSLKSEVSKIKIPDKFGKPESEPKVNKTQRTFISFKDATSILEKAGFQPPVNLLEAEGIRISENPGALGRCKVCRCRYEAFGSGFCKHHLLMHRVYDESNTRGWQVNENEDNDEEVNDSKDKKGKKSHKKK